MLARKEAEQIMQHRAKFINQELVTYFPNRTIEAIKGRRRRQDHGTMVAEYVEKMQTIPPQIPPTSSPPPTLPLDPPPTSPSPPCVEDNNHFLNALEAKLTTVKSPIMKINCLQP